MKRLIFVISTDDKDRQEQILEYLALYINILAYYPWQVFSIKNPWQKEKDFAGKIKNATVFGLQALEKNNVFAKLYMQFWEYLNSTPPGFETVVVVISREIALSIDDHKNLFHELDGTIFNNPKHGDVVTLDFSTGTKKYMLNSNEVSEKLNFQTKTQYSNKVEGVNNLSMTLLHSEVKLLPYAVQQSSSETREKCPNSKVKSPIVLVKTDKQKIPRKDKKKLKKRA